MVQGGSFKKFHNMIRYMIVIMHNTVPYRKCAPPPHPTSSAVDMAQTGEGAYFQKCAKCLKYNPPPHTALAGNLT